MFAIETLVEELREVAARLEPDTFAGRDAARLTAVCAEGERLFAAAKMLFARRAADTNGWHRGSDATSGEEWLARLSGCSESQARDTLQTGKRLKDRPKTRARLRDGKLSPAQASAVTRASEAAPEAEDKLLRSAERDSLRELRERADRIIAANTDDAEAHAKATRERHLRTWRDGLATRGSFSGPTEAVDKILRALEPLTEQRFEEARKAGEREPYEAYRFDALVALAAGMRTKSGPPITRLRVDLDRLLGNPDGTGEVCEIPGVGPVSVAQARRVLPYGLMELVITNGIDVRTVVTRTRHVPEALKLAISERDQRCKVRGCGKSHRLERHHTKRYSEHHLTAYDVLGMLCGDHHDFVTYDGYEIVDHHDGSWSLERPDEDRSTDAA
jgi:hypothetical protein